MRRIPSILLSSIMISAFLVTFFAPFVSAASPFDDTIRVTNQLQILTDDGLVDASNTYLAGMENSCNSSVYESWLDALSNPNAGWTVTQGGNGEAGEYTISLAWVNDRNTNQAYFTDTGGGASQLGINADGLMSVTWDTTTDAYTCYQAFNNPAFLTNYAVSQYHSSFLPNQFARLFLANVVIDYPDGYDGIYPPDSADVGVDIWPRMYYSVEDKKIHANPMLAFSAVVREYIPVYGGTAYINYLLSKCTDDSYSDCEDVQVFKPSQIETSGFDFTVANYGNYVLSAQYTFPSPVPPPDPVDVQFNYTLALFQLNVSGETFDGSYLDENCDENFCEAKEPYKDCFALYGGEFPFGIGGGEFPDIIGGFGCVMENFGAFMRTTLRTLFGAQNIADFSRSLVDFNTNTYGLTSIVTAPISFLEEIRQGTYSCSPLAVPLPFTGMSYTLPCMTSFWEGLGSFYTLYQTVVNGFVSYYVIVGMLGLVKGFKDPQNDKIEVLKL